MYRQWCKNNLKYLHTESGFLVTFQGFSCFTVTLEKCHVLCIFGHNPCLITYYHELHGFLYSRPRIYLVSSSAPFLSSGSGRRKVRQHPSARGGGISRVWDDPGCGCGGGAGHPHFGGVVLQGWKLCATRILPQTQSPNAQELPELCECKLIQCFFLFNYN